MRKPGARSAVLSLLLLAACAVEPATGPREVPLPPGPDVDTSPEPEGYRVVLLEPGAEPRRTLRYHPSPDEPQRLTMDLRFEGGWKRSSGGAAHGKADIQLALQTSAGGPAGTRGMLFEFRIPTATLQRTEPEDPDLQAAVEALSGLRGQLWLTDRGLPTGFAPRLPRLPSLDATASASTLLDLVEGLPVPLPREPVGAGAQWRVERSRVERKARYTVLDTYTLTALDGDRGEVSIASTSSGKDQPYQVPRLPQGATVRLVELASSSEGTASFDLAQPWPLTGSGGGKSESAAHVSAPDSSFDVQADRTWTAAWR